MQTLSVDLKNFMNQQLNRYFSDSHELNSFRQEAGGDINMCYSATYGAERVFIKTNTHKNGLEMLLAEEKALRLIQQAIDTSLSTEAPPQAQTKANPIQPSKTQSILLPKPILTGSHKNIAFIVMSYIPLYSATADQLQWQTLGRGLAQLHRNKNATYGWFSSNFIGYSIQNNTEHSDWCEFWLSQRLLPQLEMAYGNGYEHALAPLKAALVQSVAAQLQQHHPTPSLLHGDLWSGNVGFTDTKQPAIYDPAAYFGDRETDLAMTHLFGSFPQAFYQAYNAEWPMDQPFKQRQPIYNLYHILNHLNLFGPRYLSQCVATINNIIQA